MLTFRSCLANGWGVSFSYMTPRPRTRLSLVTLLALSAAGCRGLAPDTEIGRAAAAGGVTVLESLLHQGADPNLLDSHGIAPLHTAARLGRVDAIRALVKAGARVDLHDRRNGWTPLLHAVHKRQHRAAVALLESGADPNRRAAGHRGAMSVPPLIMAAGYGMTDTVKVLLERGADPRAETGPGLTALWGALGGGGLADITDGPGLGVCFPETVRVLIASAPDLRLPNNLAARAARFLSRSEECRGAYALAERRRS